MNWIQSQGIQMALALFGGSLASMLYQYVKKASVWVDALPPQAHAFVAGAIAIVLPMLGKLVPGFDATTLAGIDPTVISALLALAASQITHMKLSK